MYRITVTSKGKYKNVVLGSRYCFRKKTAIEMGKLFLDRECDFTVEKFIRISNDTYCWSSSEIGIENLLEKIYNK